MTPVGPGAWDAVVVAGGASRRMGGVDKTTLEVAGRTLLDGVLAACRGAATTVVVGPERPTPRRVRWTREDPPGGGPVPAVLAGLALVDAPVVVLLAADLVALDEPAVRQLVAAAPALAVDESGAPQWLCSAWPTELLRSRPRDLTRMSELLADLGAARLDLGPAGWSDCDTPEDLQRARERT